MAIAVLCALATFVFPGFGQGFAGRARRTAIWAVAGIATEVGVIFTVWSLAAHVAVRLASAIDAFWCVHRARQPGAGGVLVAVSVVVTVVGGVAVRLVAVEAFKNVSSSMNPTLEVTDHVFVDKLSLRWRAPEPGELVTFEYPCDPDRTYIKRVVAVAGDTVEVRCNVLYINSQAVADTLVEDGEHCSYQDYMDAGASPTWQTRPCSRYRETLAGRTFDVFHDSDRPARDRELAAGTLAHVDSRDFPAPDIMPSCENTMETTGRPIPAPSGKLVVTKREALPCEPQAHFVVPDGELFVLGDNRANSNDSRVWGPVKRSAVLGRVIGTWYPLGRFGGVR